MGPTGDGSCANNLAAVHEVMRLAFRAASAPHARRPAERALTERRDADRSRQAPPSNRLIVVCSEIEGAPAGSRRLRWRFLLAPSTLFQRPLEENQVGDRDRKTALFDQFARVGKAVASGKRLELLDLLAQGERDVASLADAAGLGVTSASAHLQILRQANLVTTRRDGTRVLYRLAGRDVAELYARLREVAQSRLPDVDAARRAYLGNEGGEPVTREELQRLTKKGKLTVLDVRPREEYAAGHIPGAVSIPLDELDGRLAELPGDGQIVAYCRGAYCVLAHDAVRLLAARGRTAQRLTDGMLEWRLADLPVAVP
jgi:rhodanese-related sulfurtransferase/DNA-binding transcriptional ArsR family regulator